MAVTLAEVGAVPSVPAAGRAGDALAGAGAGEVWPEGPHVAVDHLQAPHAQPGPAARPSEPLM